MAKLTAVGKNYTADEDGHFSTYHYHLFYFELFTDKNRFGVRNALSRATRKIAARLRWSKGFRQYRGG